MLKKLFKYDFNSIKGIWWIIAIALPVISLFGAIAFRIFLERLSGGSVGFFGIIGILIFLLSLLVLFGSSAVTSIFVYYRFYKNLYTDEGYLTFTLPVKRSRILLSKTLNAIFWQSLHTILIFACLFIYFLISPPTADGALFNTVLFSKGWDFTVMALSEYGGWIFAHGVSAMIFLSVSVFFSVALIQFCITVGAVWANKYKLLVGIGVYYIVNMGISLVFQIVGTFGSLFVLPAFESYISKMSFAEVNFSIILLTLIASAAFLLMSFTFYFLTLDGIERKLNLA